MSTIYLGATLHLPSSKGPLVTAIKYENKENSSTAVAFLVPSSKGPLVTAIKYENKENSSTAVAFLVYII